jgi:multimeric flavodoxin WrbA
VNHNLRDLQQLFINTSLQADKSQSHTLRLINRAAGIMKTEGVAVEVLHARDYNIGFGMVKDASTEKLQDDWPTIHQKIMAADIFVLGTPIWLGVKSSLATLVVERMYAYSGDRNEQDQYLYYGKTAGCIITGNEDGAKACSMDILFAMQHIGYTIPPQADCAWLGEVGPGPSYGDEVEGSDVPAGYDSDFTNRNTTIMAWNLMHMGRLLKEQGGFPVGGNQISNWRDFTNAADQSPDSL